MLRRVKADVLKELQPKREEELSLPMPAAQRATYRAILAQARAQAEAGADDLEDAYRNCPTDAGSDAWTTVIVFDVHQHRWRAAEQ